MLQQWRIPLQKAIYPSTQNRSHQPSRPLNPTSLLPSSPIALFWWCLFASGTLGSPQSSRSRLLHGVSGEPQGLHRLLQRSARDQRAAADLHEASPRRARHAGREETRFESVRRGELSSEQGCVQLLTPVLEVVGFGGG